MKTKEESNIYLRKENKETRRKITDLVVLIVLISLIYLGRNGFIKAFKGIGESLTVYRSYYIKGLGYSLGLSLISVILGSILGAVVYFLRVSNSRILSSLMKAYVEIIRGTPMLVQLSIVFFGASQIINTRNFAQFPFIAGIVAVSINSSAYVSEIFRSGIESIGKGQMEAGRSLGMSYGMTMKEIIMPQAVKNILPALVNEFITVIKETSIVSFIGVADIMYNVNIVSGISYKPMDPLYISAIMYFTMTFSLSKLLSKLERKLKESD